MAIAKVGRGEIRAFTLDDLAMAAATPGVVLHPSEGSCSTELVGR